MTTTFTWVPFYEELGRALIAYETRQPELVAFLRGLLAKGLKPGNLTDMDASGETALVEIDPFTFIACFNRGIRDEERKTIAEAIRSHFGLKAPVPTDFAGIPVADNRQSWFFPYAKERRPDDIPKLWELARAAVQSGRSGVPDSVFDRCLTIKSVGRAKLTMGLYWLRPNEFLPLDSRSSTYLAGRGVEIGEGGGWSTYQRTVDAVGKALGTDFPALSLAAWRSTAGTPTPVADGPKPSASPTARR